MDLKEYKQSLKTKLIDSFFESKNNISGKDIINFCDEKQINMFVIFLLLKEWKVNMDSLKSPYFDFNNSEVKEALSTYMNTISKHILIQKNDFDTLLTKAIDYTFQLAENPESFIVSNRLENDLQELNKYVQYHKPYFEGDKDYEVENKLNEVKSKFDNVLGFTENEESIDKKVVFDETEVKESKPLVELYEDEEPELILNKIESIKNTISINQKFIFINELFNGNSEQYNQTIERLENCEGFNEADNIMLELNFDDSVKEASDQLSLLIKQKYNI